MQIVSRTKLLRTLQHGAVGYRNYYEFVSKEFWILLGILEFLFSTNFWNTFFVKYCKMSEAYKGLSLACEQALKNFCPRPMASDISLKLLLYLGTIVMTVSKSDRK